MKKIYLWQMCFDTLKNLAVDSTQIHHGFGGKQELERMLKMITGSKRVNRDRWAEECKLVMAELNYTKGTFVYMQRKWLERALEPGSPGSVAHAHTMSNMYHRMAEDVCQIIEMHQ
ncbi:hypothetical protein FS842_008963 [Serendipita sp. 407]|nr:hypothetical protein FS842_008963 [Serendipita sp. 407]